MNSSKMSYTKNLLSSSRSLKNKEVLSNNGGGGVIERSGSSFGKHYGNCLLLSLKMAHVCISSYSSVIFLSLSHTNPIIPHTTSTHSKSVPMIVTLCFGLSLSRVNVSMLFVVPQNVHEKFHLKPTIL